MLLYWDEKLMEDLTGDQKFDRLLIVEQLFAIPKLSAGTGQAIAHAMMEAVSRRKLKPSVLTQLQETLEVKMVPVSCLRLATS